VSAFGPGLVRFYQASSAQSRRDKFAREQFPEFSELVKRFAQLTDSSDGKSIRNILFYGCGNNQTEFDRLCSPDYLKEIWPHFFARLGKRSRNEAEFRNALKEFYTLAASYNNNYVLEPFKRMKNKQWMPATTSNLTPELKSWLSSLPEHHRTSVEAQIEDFRERWVSYLDDLVPFLDRLHDSLGTSSSRIESYFERPSKV